MGQKGIEDEVLPAEGEIREESQEEVKSPREENREKAKSSKIKQGEYVI